VRRLHHRRDGDHVDIPQAGAVELRPRMSNQAEWEAAQADHEAEEWEFHSRWDCVLFLEDDRQWLTMQDLIQLRRAGFDRTGKGAGVSERVLPGRNGLSLCTGGTCPLTHAT